jgi:putative addiction module antidote
MLRKVFRTGNSVVISLPKDALQLLGVAEGEEVSIDLDKEKHQVIITPAEKSISVAGLDEAFAQQLTTFIEQYRPALETLAQS